MKKDDCIFCKLANGEIPTNSLYEDDDLRVIFDLNPATKGHVLILPKEHYDNVFSMDEETASKVFRIAPKIAGFLKDELNCDGMNILQNNGEIAGQTVFHFHMHIIPRYNGDSVCLKWSEGKLDEQLAKDLGEKLASRS